MFTESYFNNLCFNSVDIGELQKCLQDSLSQNLSPGLEVKVAAKLYLVMPFASRQNSLVTSSLREVNAINYRDCFSILRESAVFDFRAFKLTSSMVDLSVSNLLGNQRLCKYDQYTEFVTCFDLYFLII